MRILVVEDEEKLLRFLVRGLTAARFAVDVSQGVRLERRIRPKFFSDGSR